MGVLALVVGFYIEMIVVVIFTSIYGCWRVSESAVPIVSKTTLFPRLISQPLLHAICCYVAIVLVDMMHVATGVTTGDMDGVHVNECHSV